MLVKFPHNHHFGSTYAGLIFTTENRDGTQVVTGVTEECKEHFDLFNKPIVLSRAQDLVNKMSLGKIDNVVTFREDHRASLKKFAEKWQTDVNRRRAK